ncbi:FCS-Like Zinc finger 8-like isoform X2 [Aristolochia californica]
MLRKRSRAVHTDQSRRDLMPDSTQDSSFSSTASAPKNKNTAFFRVPGLFVAFGNKVLSDSDSARSPTSPLDFKGFSNPINPLGSPRVAPNGSQKSWDCSRVGLSILDSLSDESKPCGRVFGVSESRNILLGSQMKINVFSNGNNLHNSLNSSASPKSSSEHYAMSPQSEMKCALPWSGSSETMVDSTEIHVDTRILGKSRSCSSGSFQSPSTLTRVVYCNPKSISDNFCSETKMTQLDCPRFVEGGSNFDNFSGIPSSLPVSVGRSRTVIMASLSASEIELSEDYTRVISHGPNPKTTHIFGDCILESHASELSDLNKEGWGIGSPCFADDPSFPADDFLSYCFSCKKKLEEGKDIFMYRGEKAFCSCSCRMQEILDEEEREKLDAGSLTPKLIQAEEVFPTHHIS